MRIVFTTFPEGTPAGMATVQLSAGWVSGPGVQISIQ